ncbi:MAG TPA: MerR family transcriptional regulator [Acidimicrobiales bacterium]|nr:MerR family transcriptional regulator [Acidimicrobiales bacterium]
MFTHEPSDVRSAPEAAELAGVTYRQLDYWTRKGWIDPAAVEEISAGRRVRRYGAPEIVQCALLAHLGGSGIDVTPYGPHVAELGALGPDDLVVIGPAGALEVVAATELRQRVGQRGRHVVFDPEVVLRRFGGRSGDGLEADRVETGRRSA